ncbi:hypothetical protein [Cellulomonas telluris]|uniref:hypothetical protein n=1 Tax=Cellulomonas telluris TaxID=2306636 RepID=UPI0010A8DDB0|nr:hypothetical protein [Cellulomonas telluris]
MSNDQFERLIDAMPRIAAAVNAFESDALRERALDSLLSAFGVRPVAVATGVNADDAIVDLAADAGDNDVTPPSNGGRKRAARRAGGRRSGGDLVFDKSISGRPEGKESLRDFLDRAKPANQNEQVLAIVYWLDNIAEVDTITLDTVFTGFRLAELKVPGSFAAKVSQTGSKGWLKETTRERVSLSVGGEDRVIHEMLKRSDVGGKG